MLKLVYVVSQRLTSGIFFLEWYHQKRKIKRYSSIPTPVHGEARCAVSFGKSSLPDVWHIISGYCETILFGSAVQKLGIIQLNSTPETFQPISMIEDCKSQELYNCLARYLENFSGLGKLKNYKVKLHINSGIKPVSVQQSSIPYHLKIQADQALNKMIKDGVENVTLRINQHHGYRTLL